MDVLRYLPPALPPLRWLADVGPDLSSAVQVRLRDLLFGEPGTLVLGSVVSIATTFVAYSRSGNEAFTVIAAIDALMLPVRIIAWQRQERPTDLVFATGLLWATLIATTVFLAIVSRDLPMSLLAMAWSFASISGIVGRNYLAPRYAVTQVGLITLGTACGIVHVEPGFLMFAGLLSAFFVFVSHGLVARQRDMTIRVVTSELESRSQSYLDPLTGLLNRRGLEAAFERLATPSPAQTGLLYLDLDGFKQVNDRLGHGAGDRLLAEVARRLTAASGSEAAVCRLGGDEFLVLAPGTGSGELRALGARIIASVGEPYRIADAVLARVGASVGAVAGAPEAADLTRMMSLADKALYTAKASGKGRCILYAADPDEARSEGGAEPLRRRVGSAR